MQPTSLCCFAMACKIFVLNCFICNVRLCSYLVTQLWCSVDAYWVLCCMYLFFLNVSPAAASILSSVKSTHSSSSCLLVKWLTKLFYCSQHIGWKCDTHHRLYVVERREVQIIFQRVAHGCRHVVWMQCSLRDNIPIKCVSASLSAFRRAAQFQWPVRQSLMGSVCGWVEKCDAGYVLKLFCNGMPNICV